MLATRIPLEVIRQILLVVSLPYKARRILKNVTFLSNFAGSMKGNLLGMAHANKLYNVGLNANGNQVTSKTILTLEIGERPLDVIAQGDNDVFPGTIWVVDNILKAITVLEPSDY